MSKYKELYNKALKRLEFLSDVELQEFINIRIVGESKWIQFIQHLRSKGKTTDVWEIVAKGDQKLKPILGHIKWYAPWRKYAFFPSGFTVFEKDCMLDIVTFINSEMSKRKNAKKMIL